MTNCNSSICKKYHGATGYEPVDGMVELFAHELPCLVCFAGGCPVPPDVESKYKKILETLHKDPMLPMRLKADLDIACVNTKKKDGIEPDELKFDYCAYKRDFDILRLLGISTGDIRPAYYIFNELFKELKDISSICSGSDANSKIWPACPNCEKGYYEKVINGKDVYSSGVYKILQLPTKEGLVKEKERTSAEIQKADHLYLRPAHLMCMLCVLGRDSYDEPMWQDNLVEIRRKIQEKPDIPVTLVLGTNCDVCGPCPVFDKSRNLCLGHQKPQLRDYMVLCQLGLVPNTTMSAKKLFDLVMSKIKNAKQICGWGDMKETSNDWRNCVDVCSGNYEKAIEKGLFN